jgi:glycosyltransferase involved in cell wall biosynthesis
MLNFDIIHAHDWLTFPAGIAAKSISGKPLIIHVHATEFDRSGGNVNPGVFDIEKSGMQMADKIIAVSNLTRKIIIDKYNIPPDKVITIHNAVEPTARNGEYTKAEGMKDKIVTFLGRVTMQKGPEYFIEAANKVLRKMRNVRFVMAGSGDMLNKMIHRVAALKIGDRFNFTGFLQGEDVNKMFALSDVYVMPSVSEPFGISPLEALQSNVPVIISKQSGVSEILKHAIKIDFWDIDAMADAIYGILNYPGLKKMFEHYGKSEVESLKWENTAGDVLNVYKSIV